jgi:hypothetical protein
MPLDGTPAHYDSQYNLPSIINQIDEPDPPNYSDMSSSNIISLINSKHIEEE